MDGTPAIVNLVARYRADLVTPDELVAESTDLLSEADIPPALLALAALPARGNAPHDVADLISDLSASVGGPTTDDDVARSVTLGIADRIVRGAVSPIEGANLLWTVGRRLGDPFGVLGATIELIDAWETDLAGRPGIETEIRTLAARIAGPSG